MPRLKTQDFQLQFLLNFFYYISEYECVEFDRIFESFTIFNQGVIIIPLDSTTSQFDFELTRSRGGKFPQLLHHEIIISWHCSIHKDDLLNLSVAYSAQYLQHDATKICGNSLMMNWSVLHSREHAYLRTCSPSSWTLVTKYISLQYYDWIGSDPSWTVS